MRLSVEKLQDYHLDFIKVLRCNFHDDISWNSYGAIRIFVRIVMGLSVGSTIYIELTVENGILSWNF